MKFFYLVLVFAPLLMANETERIDDIVSDITKLRHAYEQCQSSLDQTQTNNASLVSKLKVRDVEAEAQEESVTRQIEDLRASKQALIQKNKAQAFELTQAKKRIKVLEQMVADQRAHIASFSPASKPMVKPCSCKDDNPFPKLLPKTAPQPEIVVKKQITKLTDDTHVESKKIVQVPKKVEATVVKTTSPTKKAPVTAKREYFNPTTFHLMQESHIFDAPEGKIVHTWEKKRSFTSNEKQGSWIRITGYFVDGKWRSAKREKLWIKQKAVEEKR